MRDLLDACAYDVNMSVKHSARAAAFVAQHPGASTEEHGTRESKPDTPEQAPKHAWGDGATTGSQPMGAPDTSDDDSESDGDDDHAHAIVGGEDFAETVDMGIKGLGHGIAADSDSDGGCSQHIDGGIWWLPGV